MHDSRTSTALRQLVDLGIETVPSPWRWSIVNLESIGQIILPGHARQALARSPGDPEVRARAVRVAWLLARTSAGVETWVDGRGRVYLPAWLRSTCGNRGGAGGTRSTDGVVFGGLDPAAGRFRRPSCGPGGVTEGLRANDLLDKAAALGAELADLVLAAVANGSQVPTVANYVAAIAPTFRPGTAATYSPYWRVAIAHLGHRRLSEVTVVDLQAVVADAGQRATRRRQTSSGRSSRESCVGALRALFARAQAAGLIRTDPAALLTKPRRARSRRRALDDTELAELIDAVRVTSNDPDLDLLVVRFHLESGARRQGALNLRLRDLDPRRAIVWLREKGDNEREQPISPSLIALLERHARTRSAHDPNDQVLRSHKRRPITARRYDTLFSRARRCLPWSDRTPVSAHVLRHTAITAVGRHGGYPIAQTFAGHAPPSVTGRYMQASLEEVAATIAALTGEPHPLERSPSGRRRDSRCRTRAH